MGGKKRNLEGEEKGRGSMTEKRFGEIEVGREGIRRKRYMQS